ncbi:MAG: N(2)-acetyl-L-2,4-diaminobutanoate deacetylase DoeB2 [Hydrogenovibrio sp.]|nr:N(2)-acetyl-L-2,4-diaminobutanoate deacetylase DoeB2 [Hydrogenovibrio sp.]MDR9499559.1 N(2)-acetyl-L-2,4-diaminobutanoate deacetylase DoeB2 [Hydrogenovibrio sp.]
MTLDWQTHLNDTRATRQWLHQHPELTWQEAGTARFVREQLDALGIAWRPCAEHGCVATLAPKASGRHIALRSDMDALPIMEATGLDFASKQAGVMHACGHDGHMAALLGAAKWLKAHEPALPGPVSLLFQPAEEGGHGARAMIEDGALEGIDEIYGWHNWPALPLGTAVCPTGAVMSGNGTFHITLKGHGGHASQPESTSDALLAASALILNLQQIVSRRLPPQVAAVVSVTSMDARNALTVIGDKVLLEGSIRFADPAFQRPINDAIDTIAHGTAQSYGVTAEVEIRPRYNPTLNHAQPAAIYRDALRAELGADSDQVDLRLPLMASEDFSYYLTHIPGAFALVGMAQTQAKNDQAWYSAPCHSPQYQFNDRVLDSVMRVFCRLAGVPVV